MDSTQNISIQDDDIALYELWEILTKRKLMIFANTVFLSCLAAIYALNATPIYTGNALIEVGEVINKGYVINNIQKDTTTLKLDANIVDLKEVASRMTNVSINIPNGSNNVIQLSFESGNPAEIKSTLQKAVDFIIARHHEKAKLYSTKNSEIRMTQLIGEIYVGNEPVKPNKKTIITIGFISGFILSIFLAFALEFLQKNRKRRD